MRDKVDGAAADLFATHHTQRQALQLWYKRAILSRNLAMAIQAKQQRDAAAALHKWRTEVRLAQAERTIRAKSVLSVLRQSWDLWHDKQ
jgi:hypothetical protein